jgi:hypothetical protein
MKRTWLASIIVLALVIIGIVVYLANPHSDETDNTPAADTHTPAQPASKPATAPPALATCVGPMDSQVSKASLVDKHKWAESLLLKNHVDTAVTELRSIATLDPGYPAINFEISDALLKSRHASEARDAMKQQLEISECLSALPPSDQQAYCDSQGAAIPQGGCAQALAKINQEAHYKAGAIDAAVARPADSHPASTKAATPAPVTPAASPAAAATVQPAEPVVPKPPPPVKIQSAEASEHVGQQATVCGAVISKHTAEESNGKPTFINLDRSPPNPTFTIVIWGTDTAAVGDFPETGNVCVTGKILLYRGNPEIILHDSQNWYRSGQL